MKNIRTSAIVLAVSLTASVAVGDVVRAAPPLNDDPSAATLITGLPYSDVVDTTDATVSAEEQQLGAFCGAPAIEHAVWYTSIPVTDGFATIDVQSSDYSAGILVVEGTPGAFTPVFCQQGSVSGSFTAGQQRYFMVFGDGLTPATSGTLQIDVRTAVEPPTIDVTLNPRASVDKFGAVTLTGTVTCSATDGVGVVFGVDGSVRQRVGRGFVDGYFFTDLGTPCDGSTVQWSALAFPDGGKFAGGKAATVAFSFGCGTDLCGGGFVEGTVQLIKGSGR